MKKILLITLDFYPKTGGVANYYLNLCKGLGKDVVVLTNMTEGDSKFDFKLVRKKILSRVIWPRWLPIFFYAYKVIRNEKVKVLWAGEVLPTGTVIYFLSKFFKIPYIVSCHGKDILQAQKKSRKKKLARKILQNAKYVTVNSKHTGELVSEMGVAKDKIKVIYPGVDISKHEESGSDILSKYNLKDKPILLSIGRLVARKGVDRVIEALPQVWQHIPDLVYMIVGSGPYEEELKKKAQGDERIIFFQSLTGDDKDRLYTACDVFIMPSRESKDDVEGFGIVYLEAASFSKPVIAGLSGGVAEAVVDGKTGILVNPDKVDEIALAIIKLFKDKDLREKLGSRGMERAKNEFNWQISISKFKELI